MTGELEHYVPADTLVAPEQIGARIVDLTIVYNAHGTAEDAHNSTAHVEQNSVVFLESFTTRPDARPNFEADLRHLHMLRVDKGVDSEAYRLFKQELLDCIASYSDYVPRNHFDFTANNLATLTDLIGKDCVVYYADFQALRGNGLSDSAADETNEQFRTLASHITRVILPTIPANAGIARPIKQLQAGVFGNLTAHAIREGTASLTVLTRMGQLAEPGMMDGLTAREDGKIAAFMLFGTAHAKSLTWHFTSRGVEPRVIEQHPLREHEYIDVIMRPGYDNARRRCGHAALQALSYNLLQYEAAQQITAESYESLAFLNGASRDEFIKFIVRCMSALREINRDEDAAYGQYEAILRDIS